ncbi:MAG: (Fe-S)-binding protein [Bacteroidales bacterium]|nr:(Fe-S)-binding protein [Bacteroidales bacterium]
MGKRKIEVPLMANLTAQGKKPDILFWVGSAGSFDDRAKKITRSFVKILEYAGINYAVLGNEETDTGDSARRAGNEFLFQMQAIQVIETLNAYGVKKIITCDPHDYNILKNEYPELGGNYEVIHHSELIKELIDSKKIILDKKIFGKIRMTYHDPCYLGRGNGVYEAPRFVIHQLTDNLTEMHRNRSKALCCGGGGAQMFKEAEKGDKEVYELRTEDALLVDPEVIVTACPLCMTMFMDGIKMKEKESEIKILDLAEIIAESLFL